MRVIAGTAHGKNLQSLPGQDVTRPTINRVKEAMFSSIQFLISGANVLDLFAGSGQLGIEALSRGAKHCVFVDQSPQANKVISANLKECSVQASATLLLGDAIHFLMATNERFDLALLDPPYHHDTIQTVLPLLEPKMSAGGVVLCETEKEAELPETVGKLHLMKQYNYGKIKVSRYEMEDQS